MVKIVYIDTLFLFNFALDYLLLQAIKKISKESGKLWREIAGALLGAALAVFLFVWKDIPMTFLVKLIGISLCVLVVFGYGTAERFGKLLFVFFAVHFAMGGGVYSLYFLFGSSAFQVQNGIPYMVVSPLFFLPAFGLVYLLVEGSYRIFTTGKGITKEIVDVEIRIRGHSYNGKGLVDTGSNLYEPISGKSAIVVEKSLLRQDVPTTEQERMGLGIRCIPYSTLHGKGMLIGIRSDSVQIRTKNGMVIHKGIYLALAEHSLSGDGSFQILLSHHMLTTIGGLSKYANESATGILQNQELAGKAALGKKMAGKPRELLYQRTGNPARTADKGAGGGAASAHEWGQERASSLD